MKMLVEGQLPPKIRHPTNDIDRGWNLCLAEIDRIMREENLYELQIRSVKNERKYK